jgi:hypothetical protein
MFLVHTDAKKAMGTKYGTIFALVLSRSSQPDTTEEAMAMQYSNIVLRKYSILTFLGLSLIALAVPWSAHAGGVHVSVGFELPVPVAVVPVPAPVVVAPPPVVMQRPPVVLEQPGPVVVYPGPVVVRQPPVVIEEQRVRYRDHLPPGLAKKFYGYEHVYWKHHHHDD